MKKIGKIALGLALLLGLSSCGNKEEKIHQIQTKT